VAHAVRVYRNVGVSVGVLYFANTLGAALGAALTGFVALYYLGLTSTIYGAALLNIGVSAAVWRSLRTEHV
jgi:predicted MFS family arabinose efflux permease